MLRSYSSLTIFIFAILVAGSTFFSSSNTCVAAEIPESDELYQGAGIETNAAVYGNEANESIDPFTGQLVRSYTDLSLPGNGGLDLSIQRTYYSKTLKWHLSFGRIRKGNDVVTIEMADGSVHYGYKESALDNENFITKDFWKIHFPLTPDTTDKPVVRTSDGTKFTFGFTADNSTGGNFYTTAIEKNNNSISIHYKTDITSLQALVDYVQDSVGRKIYFEYQNFADSGTPIYKPTKFYYCPDFGDASTCGGSEIATKYFYYQGNHALGGINPVVLKEVRPPLAPSWHYKYTKVNEVNRLQTVISPTGGVSKYTYDFINKNTPDGNFRKFFAVTQKETSGRAVTAGTYTFTYDVNTDGFDYSTVTDPTGRTTRYKYFGYSKDYPDNNAAGGGTDECWQFGLLQEVLVRGSSSVVESRTTTEWETSPLKSFATPAHRVAGLCSDSVTHIPRIKSKSIERDGKSHLTKYEEFDIHNNPTVYYEQSTLGQSSVRREFDVASYWKNETLNIVQGLPNNVVVTSPNFAGTKTTNYLYNGYGLVTEINFNAVTTKKGYDPDTNNLLWEEDPMQNRTNYQWQNGNISRVTDPAGKFVKHEINPDGTVQYTISKRGNGANSDYKTSYEYDLLGRLKKIIPPSSADHPSSTTTISYPLRPLTVDMLEQYMVTSGKKTTRAGTFTETEIDGFGRKISTNNNLGITTVTHHLANGQKDYSTSSVGDRTEFDSFGRPTEIRHQDGSTVTYNYNNGNVLITDEENNTTLQTYYAFSDPDDKLLASVRDAKQTVTSYTYNIVGQITDVVFGSTNVAHYGYDSRFYVESETHPETGTVTFTKDNAGNLKSITDSLGTRTYFYDVLNRLDYITDGSATIADYGYDFDSNLTSLTNGTVQSTMQYDPLNRLINKTDTIEGIPYATDYRYNPLDSVRQITYPSGRIVAYVFNTHNQIVGIPGFVDSVDYFTSGIKTGLMNRAQLRNNVVHLHDYNARRLMTTLSAKNTHTNTFIVDRTHGYAGDSRGNLKSITDRVAGTSRSFGYDKLNRITNFNGPWGSGVFAYSTNGNRTSKLMGTVTDTYHYTPATNRLANVSGTDGGSINLSYNGDGDVTGLSRDGLSATMDYDIFHNLTSFTQDGQLLMTFKYDATGQRVIKKNEQSNDIVIYHSDPSGNTLSEYTGNDELLADYIYLGGILIARVADSSTIPDSDFDGLPDIWETRLGLDTTIDDSLEDPDGDGVTNLDEYLNGTNPVIMCGDVSDDSYVNLRDLIMSLQVLSGGTVVPNLNSDCNDDHQVGMPEVFFILDDQVQ